MKRVLSATVSGVFLTCLALAPLAANAAQTATDGASVTTNQAGSASDVKPGMTTTDAKPGSSTSYVKPGTTMNGGSNAASHNGTNDNSVTASPGGAAPSSGSAAVKPMSRNPS